MKDDYLLNFQSVEGAKEVNIEAHLIKGSIFFIGANDGLCQELKEEHYTAYSVDDIRKGVDWLLNLSSDTEHPDVIIVSKKINEDTIAQLKVLKKTERLSEIPLIFLSKKFDKAERELAIEIGAEDYYTDKVSAEYLAFRIDFLKRLQQLSAEHAEEVDNQPEPSLHNGEAMEMWSFKRTFDIIVSATTLLLLSPVMILVALAIKLDSKGPIFYISKRAGMGYQIFNFYKFRSMKENADQILEELKYQNQYCSSNENEGSDGAVFFKVKNDPRVTKLGSFLRKTSLDELPQLFNVLKGDMSLVGNRPLPLYEAERLTQDQWALRFLAPAGITGLWQITKRGKEEMSENERVALDMEYAKKNSFCYDLKIMLKTPAALFQKEEV